MEYYSITATGYVELHREEQMRKLRVIVDYADFSKSDNILDVGAGPGWSREFFDDVVCLDSANTFHEMDDSIIVGKAEDLPFKDKDFDGILCVSAIHHFDVDVALKEMKRVVKKGGQVVITVLNKAHHHVQIIKKILDVFDLEHQINERVDTILFLRS